MFGEPRSRVSDWFGGVQSLSHAPDGLGEPKPKAVTPAEDGKRWENAGIAHEPWLLGLGFFFLSSNCCCYFSRARHFLDDLRGL